MALDKATVARIARLARIEVPPERAEALTGQLAGILTWVEQLDEVDTKDVEPMRAVFEAEPALRPDEVTEGFRTEAVLRNAPQAEGGFFVVPKMVE